MLQDRWLDKRGWNRNMIKTYSSKGCRSEPNLLEPPWT